MKKSVQRKIIIYQVFTRLFGNTKTLNKPWGSKEENGVGKFNDFTDLALKKIKELGITHIWLTGVIHHALIGDYTQYGISNDHPDVVKGRAGSPYAIKDYYSVNPDLAIDPVKRMAEFEALIQRIHQNELKVIIDIVPNHLARQYKSIAKPPGITDFGEKDDPGVEYSRNNDFYYIPGQKYQNPDWSHGHLPLNGEEHALKANDYEEFPAKWTGNGSRKPKPDINDWYETVKINYGIKPDGSPDFPILPDSYSLKNYKEHFEFWKDKDVPASWNKWREIVFFWLDKGVDGFRYDMAEMVPVEFWSYLNSAIKIRKPKTLLVAEIYDSSLYHAFIHKAIMDLLYDKVELYDTLREIVRGHSPTHLLYAIMEKHYDFSDKLLHFLENHDEHRIPASAFAGNAFKAFPAMVLSSTIDKGASMIYFGQEAGEAARENAGFGSSGRTSIFDYVGVPAHQRWMNNGKFDGALLSNEEKFIHSFYRTLLNFVKSSSALQGSFYDLHRHNHSLNNGYNGDKLYSFARYHNDEKVIILCNFDEHNEFSFRFSLYFELIKIWELPSGKYGTVNLFNQKVFYLRVEENEAFVDIKINPLESLILIFN